MILANYYKIFAMHFSGKTITNGFTDTSGTKRNLYYQDSYSGLPFFKKNYGTSNDARLDAWSSTLSATAGCVVFGDGTTPPTVNDYTLSGNIITNLTVSCSMSNGSDDSGVYVSCLYTIQNGNASAVTIGEVGALTVNCTSASTQYST